MCQFKVSVTSATSTRYTATSTRYTATVDSIIQLYYSKLALGIFKTFLPITRFSPDIPCYIRNEYIPLPIVLRI